MTNHCAVLATRDPSLFLHQPALAFAFSRFVDLGIERVRRRVLFVRVSEYADIIELDRLHEIEQLLEIFLRLPRKAYDESRSERDIRHSLAYSIQHPLIGLP